jgi:hypothetical protein
MIISVSWFSCEGFLFLSDLIKLELSQQISKNICISNLMKIRPVVEEEFRADGQMDKQI